MYKPQRLTDSDSNSVTVQAAAVVQTFGNSRVLKIAIHFRVTRVSRSVSTWRNTFTSNRKRKPDINNNIYCESKRRQVKEKGQDLSGRRKWADSCYLPQQRLSDIRLIAGGIEKKTFCFHRARATDRRHVKSTRPTSVLAHFMIGFKWLVLQSLMDYCLYRRVLPPDPAKPLPHHNWSGWLAEQLVWSHGRTRHDSNRLPAAPPDGAAAADRGLIARPNFN